jgi:hypothetical protein
VGSEKEKKRNKKEEVGGGPNVRGVVEGNLCKIIGGHFCHQRVQIFWSGSQASSRGHKTINRQGPSPDDNFNYFVRTWQKTL